MKLTAYFKHFLATTVNLNDDRIATLNERVDAISNFLRGHDAFNDHFVEVVPQGSYAQRTIIKPVGTREYDADVLLSLKEHPTWTPQEYTSELKKAFEESYRYQGMAHKRTRCVFVDYADDFHIDVVPYVQGRGITNNKADDWEPTDPEGFTAWLESKGRIVGGGRLQAVLRILKYLRDSKGTFSVKSVILTILVAEQVSELRTQADSDYYSDLPTALVHVLEDLSSHLEANESLPAIYDPSGTGQDFSLRWDQDGYANFRKQIKYYAEKIRQAYDDEQLSSSLSAWQSVLGSSFQAPPSSSGTAMEAARADDGEEFIDTTLGFPIRLTEHVRLTGRVRRVGVALAYDLPRRGDVVGKFRTIDFGVSESTVQGPHQIYWKVKNHGREARAAGQLRGQISRGDTNRHESTAYVGSHYVEVYVVQSGVCVALDRQPVIVSPRM